MYHCTKTGIKKLSNHILQQHPGNHLQHLISHKAKYLSNTLATIQASQSCISLEKSSLFVERWFKQMYKAAGSAAMCLMMITWVNTSVLRSSPLQPCRFENQLVAYKCICESQKENGTGIPTQSKHPPQLKTSPFIGTDVNLATPEDLNQLPANGVCKRASSISYYGHAMELSIKTNYCRKSHGPPRNTSHIQFLPTHLIRFFFSFSCLSLVVVTALHTVSEPQSLDTISNCSSTLLCDINITLLWQSNQRSVAPTRRQPLTGYDKGSQKGRSLSGRY